MIGWGPMMGWGFGGFGMLFMGVFWLVILGLIVWAIVALVHRSGAAQIHDRQPVSPNSAVDIVRARYARGEISKEEFNQLMADLSR